MRLGTPITHGECGKSWTGMLRAHCAACHRTFNRDSLADKHRRGPFGDGRQCVDPDTLGMVERNGIWYGAPADPVVRPVTWR